MPSKTKALNKMEQEKIEQHTGKKVQAMVQEIDYTSKEYKDYAERFIFFNQALELAINIDGEVKAYEDEEGNDITVWEYLDLPKNDYYSLTNYLIDEDKMAITEEELHFSEKELEKIRAGLPTQAEIELGIRDIVGEDEEEKEDDE